MLILSFISFTWSFISDLDGSLLNISSLVGVFKLQTSSKVLTLLLSKIPNSPYSFSISFLLSQADFISYAVIPKIVATPIYGIDSRGIEATLLAVVFAVLLTILLPYFLIDLFRLDVSVSIPLIVENAVDNPALNVPQVRDKTFEVINVIRGSRDFPL